jgi:hypothetical protein
MPFLADRVLDSGLTILTTEVNRFDICSAEPTTYAAATSTNTLGNRTAPTIGSPAARSPSGRRVTVAAITSGGTVTVNGTATHWALSDTVNSRLLATGALSSSLAVTTSYSFTTAAFDIGIPGAV